MGFWSIKQVNSLASWVVIIFKYLFQFFSHSVSDLWSELKSYKCLKFCFVSNNFASVLAMYTIGHRYRWISLSTSTYFERGLQEKWHTCHSLIICACIKKYQKILKLIRAHPSLTFFDPTKIERTTAFVLKHVTLAIWLDQFYRCTLELYTTTPGSVHLYNASLASGKVLRVNMFVTFISSPPKTQNLYVEGISYNK